MLGYADAAAACGDDAAAAKCPGSAANQRHDRDAGEARLDDAIDDLGDRKLARICLLYARNLAFWSGRVWSSPPAMEAFTWATASRKAFNLFTARSVVRPWSLLE